MNRDIKHKKKQYQIICVIILCLSGLIAILLPRIINMINLINAYGFKETLVLFRSNAKIIYFLICFLQPIVLPLPEPVTIMAGSSILGQQYGAIIGFLGSFLGIITMFYISKFLGSSIINKLIDQKKLEKFNKFIQKNDILIVLALFILPILPDEVICVGSGLAGINAYKFIPIAAIGKLITSVSLSYSLNLIKLDFRTFIICLGLILFVLIFRKVKINIAGKEQ